MNSDEARAGLPHASQPDALPRHPAPASPSLWVYLALLLAAAVLAGVGFRLEPDLPALLYSLAASLLAAVILLVLVDQRLRESDIHAVRSLPGSLKGYGLALVSPRHRQLRNYSMAFVGVLEQNLESVIEPAGMSELFSMANDGFILQGPAGTGKTTQLQLLAAGIGRSFLKSHRGLVPVLFPLRRWLPDRSLYEALSGHVNSYASVSDRAFRKTLGRQEILLILDGADEIFTRRERSLGSEIRELQEQYGAAPLVLGTRTSIPTPNVGLPVVPVRELTEDQFRAVRSWRLHYEK